ncbi:HepT-like ribonuclease domain-containing protein [Staphylothermus hellenicus]|uniref:HepT-like ribonuclease domain-containing protein n=1 Tax=Staphylothermus hellenicus TaxID=84599 RepID=UPI0001C47750|nr:HepT-like ribonuclease domain-containing protein [Staphylothermus hellenicus]
MLRGFKDLVRLRNLLVHRYWVIDDKRVYEDVRNNFRCVEELLDRIGDRYGGDQVF